MSIVDSSTTGHSRPQERKVAKQLYIGIIVLVVAAMVIFLIVGQKKETNRSENPAPPTSQSQTPTPTQESGTPSNVKD